MICRCIRLKSQNGKCARTVFIYHASQFFPNHALIQLLSNFLDLHYVWTPLQPGRSFASPAALQFSSTNSTYRPSIPPNSIDTMTTRDKETDSSNHFEFPVISHGVLRSTTALPPPTRPRTSGLFEQKGMSLQYRKEQRIVRSACASFQLHPPNIDGHHDPEGESKKKKKRKQR